MHVLSLLRAYQQVDARDSGTFSKKLLYQQLAHEPGAAGDEDTLPVVEALDRAEFRLLRDRLVKILPRQTFGDVLVGVVAIFQYRRFLATRLRQNFHHRVDLSPFVAVRLPLPATRFRDNTRQLKQKIKGYRGSSNRARAI